MQYFLSEDELNNLVSKQAYDDLVQVLRSKEELLSVVTHVLKSLFNDEEYQQFLAKVQHKREQLSRMS